MNEWMYECNSQIAKILLKNIGDSSMFFMYAVIVAFYEWQQSERAETLQ